MSWNYVIDFGNILSAIIQMQIWHDDIFLNIDWDTRDQFTFNIWNGIYGYWENRQGLTHNVLRSLKIPQSSKNPDEKEDLSHFKHQKQIVTKICCRKCHQVVYELYDIPEFKVEDNHNDK